MLRLPIIKKQVIWLVIGAHLKEKKYRIFICWNFFLLLLRENVCKLISKSEL